jgi:hypothetical protein
MQVQENRPAHSLHFFCRRPGQAGSEYFTLKFRWQLFVHFVPKKIGSNLMRRMVRF